MSDTQNIYRAKAKFTESYFCQSLNQFNQGLFFQIQNGSLEMRKTNSNFK